MSNNITKSVYEMLKKKQKEERKYQSERSQSPVSIDPNQKPLHIFTLNIDCFFELFDYLSTRDLLTFSQTCKTIQQVVGVYARDNYSEATKIDQSVISRKSFPSFGIERVETSGFNLFIRYVYHCYSYIEPLHYILLNHHELISVDHLCLDKIDLIEARIMCAQKICHQLEFVEIKYCVWYCDFYECFLKHCINLKRLYISGDTENMIKTSGNEWLFKKYPSLEHLEMTPRHPLIFHVNELVEFFHLNPNVRSFSTNLLFLLKSQSDFMESKIQLDILEVKIFSNELNGDVREIFDLLNELHRRSFYKRLHLFVERMSKNFTEEMISLRALEKLSVNSVVGGIDANHWPLLSNLKDFGSFCSSQEFDVKILASRFVNLQQLYLSTWNHSDILTFVRHLAKLKRIIVTSVIPFNAIFLNISTLNKEREKLKDAQKVIIYVPDDIFVENKWNATHGDLNLSLIKIKRCDSYRWHHYYSIR